MVKYIELSNIQNYSEVEEVINHNEERDFEYKLIYRELNSVHMRCIKKILDSGYSMRIVDKNTIFTHDSHND